MSDTSFDTQCRKAIGELRAALLDLYKAVGADPTQPQEVARRFRVNKNLTWKAAKVLEEEDVFVAASALPGSSGLEILINSLAEKGGAPSELVQKARDAGEAFDRMVEIHTDDRANMELVLDAMGGGEKPLLRSRMLAFRGASGIWGLQSQTQLVARFMAPSKSQSGFLDQTMITGWSGVRRLRSIDAWPLFHSDARNDDGTALVPGPRKVPISDSAAPDAWMIRNFCSGEEPAVRMRATDRGMSFELANGPVGRLGEFTCFFGYFFPGAVPRHADTHNSFGEFRHMITIPTRTLLLDLFVHEDVKEALAMTVEAYGNLRAGDLEPDSAMRIPLSETLLDMGPNPRVATPLVDRYRELVDLAVRRGGWSLANFRLLRLRYDYPLMNTTMSIRYPLPVAGK